MNKEPTQGLRPWLKAVLVVSLALNLAVIGLGAGAAWRFKDGAHGAGHPPMLGGLSSKILAARKSGACCRTGGERREAFTTADVEKWNRS